MMSHICSRQQLNYLNRKAPCGGISALNLCCDLWQETYHTSWWTVITQVTKRISWRIFHCTNTKNVFTSWKLNFKQANGFYFFKLSGHFSLHITCNSFQNRILKCYFYEIIGNLNSKNILHYFMIFFGQFGGLW